MTEQLALDERFRDGRAVHRHEGPFGAWAHLMNCPGQDFFSCAAFAFDQYRHVALSHLVGGLEHRFHRGTAGDQVLELESVCQL